MDDTKNAVLRYSRHKQLHNVNFPTHKKLLFIVSLSNE